MGKRKTLADNYLVDIHRTIIRVTPLFGLDRLVKLEHRKRNGILYCDNVVSVSESLTFSAANERGVPYTISYASGFHGVLGAPRSTVPNEAAAAELQRFRDDGREGVFSFTPKKGATVSVEFEKYRAFDSGNHKTHFVLEENERIERYELILDISAYLIAGFATTDLQCEFESAPMHEHSKTPARRRIRRLAAVKKGEGQWRWTVNNAWGGTVRLTWDFGRRDESRLPQTVNLEKLATELSVDSRLAKDLHNFVMICHYYVAGARSLRKIAHEMVAGKTAVDWSLESLEKACGAELIQRTKGKGLIDVTPAGEAVLDWWSQFYMRWTPISG